MENLLIDTKPEVEVVFKNCPSLVRRKLSDLRLLILETAKEIEQITNLEETLKWGEPSYLLKGGSTIRIDWKEKTPEQYAVVFKMEDSIPKSELKKCIKAALLYHKVKHLPGLGI